MRLNAPSARLRIIKNWKEKLVCHRAGLPLRAIVTGWRNGPTAIIEFDRGKRHPEPREEQLPAAVQGGGRPAEKHLAGKDLGILVDIRHEPAKCP